MKESPVDLGKVAREQGDASRGAVLCRQIQPSRTCEDPPLLIRIFPCHVPLVYSAKFQTIAWRGAGPQWYADGSPNSTHNTHAVPIPSTSLIATVAS